MSIPVRVLILDDHPADVELMVHELGEAGFEPVWQRVETEANYLAQLEAEPDVILADYKLPGFEALGALDHLQVRAMDIPFIVVTGALGDEEAAECIRQGAADYVLKDRLGRLGPAVSRALLERWLRDRQRRAEVVIRESQERYRLIAETVSDAIFLTDLEGRVLFYNAKMSEITGYPRHELEGRCFEEMLTPESTEMMRGRLEAVRAGREVPPLVEVEVVREDGGRAWVKANFVSVVDDGHVVGRLAVARDVTERKRLQAQLRQAEKLATLGELIAGIAHELNNPLAVVMGNAQLLAMGKHDPATRVRAERIVQAAERTTRVVRNFLTFARRHEAQRVPVHINESVTRAVELLAYQLRLANITGETRLAPALPLIAGDPHQLQQVTLNLINNACQAMAGADKRGTLRLATALGADGRTISVTVADDGSGIPPGDLPHIFQPFFTTKPAGEGTGLGLAIVEGIVTEHGGTISVESVPGAGATFVVSLPVPTAHLVPRRRSRWRSRRGSGSSWWMTKSRSGRCSPTLSRSAETGWRPPRAARTPWPSLAGFRRTWWSSTPGCPA